MGGGGGGSLNRFYVATTLALSSAVDTHLFSPREGFLTHQCNISENIKSNEYRDETTMRTRQQEIFEMLNKRYPTVGLRRVRPEPEHQAPTDLLKSL